MPPFAVILPAAGQSSRFGKPKLLESLAGVPVIRRTIDAFVQRDDVSQIIIATHFAEHILPMLPHDPRILLVSGGESRAHTVQRALAEVKADAEWVAIHDAARPLISQRLINRVLEAAQSAGAAGPALPLQLTIRKVDRSLPAVARGVLPRDTLVAMQTPQMMRMKDLRAAFASVKIPLESITDDLQLLELHGLSPHIVLGEERNLKITTPTDLLLAAMLLNSSPGTSKTI